MADGDDYEDEPEFTDFFSKRAKFVPKLSAEELEAASKLVEQFKEEKEKDSLTEGTESVPTKQKGKKRAPAVKKNAFECVDTVILNDDSNPLPSTRRPGCKKVQSDCQEEIKIRDLQTSPSTCSTKGRGRGRGRGAKRNQRDYQEELKKIDDLLSSPLPLTAAAKRRLNKVQRECEKELKRVEAENKKVLSSLNGENDVENDEIEIEDSEKILTILYLSEISRLHYKEDEKFASIFQRVADLLHLNVSEFLLCLRNRNIKVDDTPKSLNLTCSDIVECIPYKVQGAAESTKYDDNRLQLHFQASDMKQKTEMVVHKLEPMQNVMDRYSKIRNIPVKQMLFEFDGEKISGTETPQDLDMESGSCIDVTVINVEDKLSRKAPDKGNFHTFIDLTVDGDSDMPDIIFCE